MIISANRYYMPYCNTSYQPRQALNHLLEIQFWHYQIMFFQNTMNFV